MSRRVSKVDTRAFVERVAQATGGHVRQAGDGRWECRCPAHDDRRASLSVAEGEGGRVLIRCHAGCGFADILAALDLKPADLFPDGPRRNGNGHRQQARIVATYPYTDANGKKVFEVVRFEPKDFRQRKPNGEWNLRGVERVLYRLPAVLKTASEGGTVYLAEGEKDVDRLVGLGVCATTAPQGAGKWKPGYTDSLRGAEVVVLPDNDAAGEQHAEAVAKALHEAGVAVKVVRLPGLPAKGDVSDWLDAGGTLDQLQTRVAATAAWQPKEAGEDRRPALSNIDREADGRVEGRPIKAISTDLFELTSGWPKAAGGVLFVDQGKPEPRYLETPVALAAWMRERVRITWSRGGTRETACTIDEFHAHLRWAADTFETVEGAPHEPRVPGAYYLGTATTEPGDGQALAELLDMFGNVETPADQAMLRALLVTPAWGGPPGARPAFIIVAPDRGCGKTTLAEAVAAIWGGYIALDPDGHGADRVAQRLLALEAMQRRIVLLDNLKSRGTASFEALITAQAISGHRLYAGEAARPNRLTWIATANSPRLSRDLAARAFVLQLTRPEYRPGWREKLLAFIEANRRALQADAIGVLRGQAAAHGATDRFQSWLDGVLAKAAPFPDLIGEAVRLNEARRGEADEDMAEAELLGEAIRAQGETFVPAGKLRGIVNDALGLNLTATAAGRLVNEQIAAGRLPGIRRVRSMNVRGYEVLS